MKVYETESEPALCRADSVLIHHKVKQLQRTVLCNTEYQSRKPKDTSSILDLISTQSQSLTL